MARNSAKEENLISRLGGIRNAIDEMKKLRAEAEAGEAEVDGLLSATRGEITKLLAENDRLREALGVKERMQAAGAMVGPLARILEAHFPAADWLLSTDPKSVPPDVWNREMAGVHALLVRLREVAETSITALRELVAAETEFVAVNAELADSAEADHEGGPPDSLIEEHGLAHARREAAWKAARDLLAETEKG